MANVYLPFKTPVSEIQWITITGEGKPTMSGDKFQYTATAVLSEVQAKTILDELQVFWKDNRPKGALAKQSKPVVKPYMVKTDEVDVDGDPIKVHKTDDAGGKLYVMQAKTYTTNKDGKPTRVPVLNSKGKPVVLGDKIIGAGSRGVIHGAIGIYNVDGSNGLTWYLNKVQLTKFVEYEGSGTEVEDLGDETEGLDGLEGADEDEASTEPTNTPDV